ncbi:MAG: response regulator [Bacteroidales bacterium]|nr:response regulator [Bacteroidales bacterium]
MYRILQVEDLPSDAYLVRREVIKVLGPCEFQITEDGDNFVQSLVDFMPDLIISDFNVPGFDVFTALNLTKKNAPGTPFIVVTGSTSEELRTECLKAGAIDLICKSEIEKLGPMIINALK